MGSFEATVTSKGQITVPREIRKKLQLKKGSKVVFHPEGNAAVMKPKAKDAFEELLKLRERVPKFTPQEIEQMIKDSKKAWSRFE